MKRFINCLIAPIIVLIICSCGPSKSKNIQSEQEIRDSISRAVKDSVKQKQTADSLADVARKDSLKKVEEKNKSLVFRNGNIVNKTFTLKGHGANGANEATVILNVKYISKKKISINRVVKWADGETNDDTYETAFGSDDLGDPHAMQWYTGEGMCIHGLSPLNESGTKWEYSCGVRDGGFDMTVTLQH